MAEIVNIKVTATGSGGVIKDLEIIRQHVDYLNKTPVNIKVNASGLEGATKQITAYINAQAKLKKAANEIAVQREKTNQATQNRIAAEARLATQTAKTATEEAKLATQTEKTNTEFAKAATQAEKTTTEQAKLATQTEKTATEEAKLATQTEKTNTEFAKAATQAEKTATEEAKLAVQEEKTATAAEKRAAAEQKATQQTQQLSTATQATARSTETLWDNFLKFGRWYIVGGAFTGIINSLREALSALKAVDDELVTIRKVTGFSDSQISGIREQAFSTASAYGVSASDYLGSVAAFARAGYKEQSAALAELSTKTQIVGDTTAETANQFLLSVDAAYQYNGSIKDLTAVLDGANEIDNKYATSIEKIAEGMGIVAPVAAQMHVGVDELAAAIGTITAVTQRSGSEAARALRALFLNIAGDTKTEIDEGVTWTTGEIEGLRDVIQLYAKDAWDAAQASEGIIDPMLAMEGLAKSMEEGVLSEQKLMEMVSDIGGKLRTSQLLAIIQNWDMYSKMMTDFGDAAGSADKEVENALDSWTRKTEILKNTWAEFLSNFVNTDAVKIALDTATMAVEGLDTAVGKAAVSVGLLYGAWVIFNRILATTNPVIFAIAAALAGITTIAGAVKRYNQGVSESYHSQNVVSAADSFVSAAKSGTATESDQVEFIRAITDAEKELAEAEEDLAAKREEYDRISDLYITDNDKLLSMTKEEILANDELARSLGDAKSAVEAAEIKVQQQTIALQEAKDAYEEYGEEVDYYGLHIADTLDAVDAAMEAEAEASRAAVSSMVDDLLTLEDELDNAKLAIEAFGQATEGEKGDTFSSYAGIYEQFLEAWENGLHGSNTVKAAIEAILGPETILAYAGDWEALGEMLASDFWRGVFADGGGDYGANFMNALYEISNEYGNIVDESGRVVASFETVDDQLVLTGYDAEGLADMLGTTPDLLMAVLDAWDIYGAGLITTRQEIMNLADAAGALNKDGSVDLTAFLTSLVEDGEHTQSEIWDIYNALMALDGVDITNVPEDIGEIIGKAQTASDKVKDAAEDVGDLDDESAEPTVTLDTTEFDRAVAEIDRTLERLNKTETIITITEKTNKAAAGGTDFAEGGPTLVNEEGPEIIQEGNTARIAGGGNPTITNIQRGARVFTAEETAQILAGRSTYDVFHAAATGRRRMDSGAGSGHNTGANRIKGAGGPLYNNLPSTQTYSAAAAVSAAATAAADATSAIEDAQKEIEERYKSELDLLKSQLELLEKQGASAEERAAVITKIQETLHLEADELRGIGASEADINKISSSWWDYAEKKIKAYKEEYEDAISLAKSELTLMEKQGKSADDRIAKIEEIQNGLHAEAEYLRSIGASEEEINKLSSEWWDYEEKKRDALMEQADTLSGIVSMREAEYNFLTASEASLYAQAAKAREIQNSLHAEAEAIRSTAEYQEAVRQAAEDETKLTDEQISLLNRVVGLSTEWWKWQDKIDAALEEANDIAGKIAESVKAAQESSVAWMDSLLEDALAPLQKQLDILKAQKEEIEDEREEQEKILAVEKARIALENAEKERNVRQYNATTGQWEWVANAKTVEKAREDLANAEQALSDYYRDKAISDLEKKISETKTAFDDLKKVIKELTEGIANGTISYKDALSYLTSRVSGGVMTAVATKVATDIVNTGNKAVLDTVVSNGSDLAALAVADNMKFYDSGGILHGKGGIKATRGDEMVLPPSVTSRLLTAEKNGAFDALLNHLGIVTSVAQRYTGFGGGTAYGGIGTQNNGDSYTIGNITLSEQQARGMTVYDLAQMARGLSLRNA